MNADFFKGKLVTRNMMLKKFVPALSFVCQPLKEGFTLDQAKTAYHFCRFFNQSLLAVLEYFIRQGSFILKCTENFSADEHPRLMQFEHTLEKDGFLIKMHCIISDLNHLEYQITVRTANDMLLQVAKGSKKFSKESYESLLKYPVHSTAQTVLKTDLLNQMDCFNLSSKSGTHHPVFMNLIVRTDENGMLGCKVYLFDENGALSDMPFSEKRITAGLDRQPYQVMSNRGSLVHW